MIRQVASILALSLTQCLASATLSAENAKEPASSVFGFSPSAAYSNGHHRARLMLNHPKRHHHHVAESIPSSSQSIADDMKDLGAVSFVHTAQDAHKRTSLRPGAGGDADVVEFGVYCKNFYGADLKSNTFRVDIVVSLRWKDLRAAELVPRSLPRVVFSSKEAASKLWEPDVDITNHDIRMHEIISSSIQVMKNGTVEKVERSQVEVNNNFELGNYPFDIQEFRVKIASSKYMSNDLVLEPMEDAKASGPRKGLLDHSIYSLNSWFTKVYEEADGDLVKSRGELDIVADRRLDKYTQDHLVPTGIILMVSWGVFFFPFVKLFATPRLVLSIVALLTFTHIIIKSSALLPGAAPFNWNDLLNQNIQLCIFNTVLINVISELCFHHFELEELAQTINHEAKFVQPTLSMFNVIMILSLGRYRIVSLFYAALLTQLVFFISFSIYGYSVWRRFHIHQEIKRNTPRSATGSAPGSVPASTRSKDTPYATARPRGYV